MNTKNLNRKLKGYTKTSLRAGNEDSAVVDVIDDLQSITDEDDHSIDTSHDTSDVVDAEYVPNPAIITEMMTEINEEPEITNADTAFKLLSDSNEALRRLDIISMNVNYPVSGYRANNATILAAEPGLESLVPNASLSKRRLTQAIESTKMQIIKAAFTAFIKWFRDKLDISIARLRSLFQSKPESVTAAEIKTVAEASNSSEVVKAPKESNVAPVNTGSTKPQQLALGYNESESTQTRVRKTNSSKQTTSDTVIAMSAEVEEVPLKVFVRSTFESRVWHTAGHWARHMVTDIDKSIVMMGLIKELSSDVGGYLSNTAKLYVDISSKADDTEQLVENYSKTNATFLKNLRAYGEIQTVFIRNDTLTPPVMSTFLANAQKILALENGLGIDKFIKTNMQSRDVYNAMDSLYKNFNRGAEDFTKKSALDAVKRDLITVASLYGTLPYTTDAIGKLHSAIKSISAEINGVYRL